MQAPDLENAADVETIDAAGPPDAPTQVLPPRADAPPPGPPADPPTLHDVADEAALAVPASDSLAQAVVLRVLAWHNRNRLVKPVRAEQIDSVGVVALPFAPQGKKGPQPVFDEDFAAPLSVRALRRFAARHAVAQRPGAAAWPQRDVKARAGAPEAEHRYLLTAAIQQGDQRLRLLLSPHDGGPVIGPRQWRWPPRMMAAGAALSVALLAGAVGGLLWVKRPAAHGPVMAAASAPQAASGAQAASAPRAPAGHAGPTGHDAAPAPAGHAVAAASAASGAGAGVAQAEPHASAPAASHGESDTAHAKAPASGPAEQHAAAPKEPGHDDPAKAPAAPHARPLPPPTDPKASTQDAAAPAALPPGHQRVATQAATPAAAPAATGPVRAAPPDRPLDLFALISKPAPTRAMAEHDLASLRDLMAMEPHATATHLEVMPLQGRWLVVWWPFVSRQQAEHARAQWLSVVPAAATQGWQVMSF